MLIEDHLAFFGRGRGLIRLFLNRFVRVLVGRHLFVSQVARTVRKLVCVIVYRRPVFVFFVLGTLLILNFLRNCGAQNCRSQTLRNDVFYYHTKLILSLDLLENLPEGHGFYFHISFILKLIARGCQNKGFDSLLRTDRIFIILQLSYGLHLFFEFCNFLLEENLLLLESLAYLLFYN